MSFFNWILPYKRKFFFVIFFEKVSPYFMEKNMFEFWCDAKSWIFWALSVNFAFDSAQKRVFYQSCTTSRELSIGNLMEDFRLLVTEKKQFEGQDFTLSIASFGGIGKSESQIKDRNLWLCDQVCLLKCKRFDGHSDGTNQNWVDLGQTEFENRDIIHFICTPRKF